jgi:hypothetical protein
MGKDLIGDLLMGEDPVVIEGLQLTKLFFQIEDRRERLRIIAIAEAALRQQTRRQANPDAEVH